MEKSGDMFGEDFCTCQESMGNLGEDFEANFGPSFGGNFRKLHLKVCDFFQKLRSAEGRC